MFRAILFAVYACGFRPRCALEINDSSENRLGKIKRIIEDCRLGIHDISLVELDEGAKLPRFNMPFELGMFFGAKRFGAGRQKRKLALILDRREFQYRASLSDISGYDISVHDSVAETAIRRIRDWLDAFQRSQKSMPGGSHIAEQFRDFSRQLPAASRRLKLAADELTYPDICRAIEAWLKDHA